MRINSNGGAADVANVTSRPQADGAGEQSRLGTDSAALSASQALHQASLNVPAIRPEKVAQAKALLNDDSYPSSTHLAEVAGLLAKHLAGQTEI